MRNLKHHSAVFSTKKKKKKNLVDDGCAKNVIPLPNLDGKTLAKVLEWCKFHLDMKDEEDNKKEEKEKLKKYMKLSFLMSIKIFSLISSWLQTISISKTC